MHICSGRSRCGGTATAVAAATAAPAPLLRQGHLGRHHKAHISEVDGDAPNLLEQLPFNAERKAGLVEHLIIGRRLIQSQSQTGAASSTGSKIHADAGLFLVRKVGFKLLAGIFRHREHRHLQYDIVAFVLGMSPGGVCQWKSPFQGEENAARSHAVRGACDRAKTGFGFPRACQGRRKDEPPKPQGATEKKVAVCETRNGPGWSPRKKSDLAYSIGQSAGNLRGGPQFFRRMAQPCCAGREALRALVTLPRLPFARWPVSFGFALGGTGCTCPYWTTSARAKMVLA